MSTDYRAIDSDNRFIVVITYIVLILGALISLTFGRDSFPVASVILIFFILIGITIFGIYKRSSRQPQAAEPVADLGTGPVYYEETTPEDVESKTPSLSCPDCGHKNPVDADFCIRCGQDLEFSDSSLRGKQ